MVQSQDTLARIHIRPWGHYLNKLGLGPQGKATEPTVLEKKIFKYTLLAKPSTSWDRTILNKFGIGQLENATYQITSI